MTRQSRGRDSAALILVRRSTDKLISFCFRSSSGGRSRPSSSQGKDAERSSLSSSNHHAPRPIPSFLYLTRLVLKAENRENLFNDPVASEKGLAYRSSSPRVLSIRTASFTRESSVPSRRTLLLPKPSSPPPKPQTHNLSHVLLLWDAEDHRPSTTANRQNRSLFRLSYLYLRYRPSTDSYAQRSQGRRSCCTSRVLGSRTLSASVDERG